MTSVDPRTIGHAIAWLGGGRTKADDTVDPAVGFVIPVKPGQKVTRGQLLGTVHARDAAGAHDGLEALRKAIRPAAARDHGRWSAIESRETR